MRRRFGFLSQVLLPLIAGGCLYLLFRSTDLLMFRWADWAGLTGALQSARDWARPIATSLPGWVRFSLPTALYYLSVLNYCWLFWMPGDERMARHWTWGVTLLAFGVEFVQVLYPPAGTFSWQDVAVYALIFPLSLPFRYYLGKPLQGAFA